jgi:hypothetical protein
MTCRAIPARRKVHGHQGQCCLRYPERTEFREETSGKSERKQRHEEPRLKEAAASEEGEHIRQDLQEDRRAEGR